MISQQQIQDIKNRFEIVGNSIFLNRAIEKAKKLLKEAGIPVPSK